MIEVVAQVDIDRPADTVWAVLADYARDTEWRAGVVAMRAEPAGVAAPGTRTGEQIRFAGRTLHNDGEVTAVVPGRRLAWRTTSGVDAEGSRAVEALGPARCRVLLLMQVRPRGADRVIAPLARVLLGRRLAGDARRLRALVEAPAPVGP